jgi:hypothetical protein
MVDERGFPDPSPGDDCDDVDILVYPCTVQKNDVFDFVSVTSQWQSASDEDWHLR